MRQGRRQATWGTAALGRAGGSCPRPPTARWCPSRGYVRPPGEATRGRGYLRCVGGWLRNRTPGPPPFSSMNSTPAASNARLMTSSVARRG